MGSSSSNLDSFKYVAVFICVPLFSSACVVTFLYRIGSGRILSFLKDAGAGRKNSWALSSCCIAPSPAFCNSLWLVVLLNLALLTWLHLLWHKDEQPLFVWGDVDAHVDVFYAEAFEFWNTLVFSQYFSECVSHDDWILQLQPKAPTVPCCALWRSHVFSCVQRVF